MNNSNPPSDSPQQQAEEIIRLVRNSLQSIQQVNVAAAAFQPASSNSHEGTLGVNAQTGGRLDPTASGIGLESYSPPEVTNFNRYPPVINSPMGLPLTSRPSISSGFSLSSAAGGTATGLARFPSPGLGFQSLAQQGAPHYPPRISSVMEMRRQFAPYSYPSRGRRQGASPREPRYRPVLLKIFCLGGPCDDAVPTMERIRQLLLHDLGASMITVDRSAPSNAVAESIRVQFPQLGNNEFELLRAIGQGSGNPLARIQRDAAIPECSVILGSRAGTVYVRPLSDILQISMDDDDSSRGAQAGIASASISGPESGVGRPAMEPYQLRDAPRGFISGSPTTVPAYDPQHGGFHFDTESSGQLRSENFVSLEEYRDALYRRNPGEQIMIIQSRDNFVQEVLGMYKDPAFNFKKRTHVVFAGEPGRDINGLSREFFSSGIDALKKGRIGNHPFFVGEMDHLGPSCYSALLSDGVYRLIGKFLAHSAIHFGLAFVGMSHAILKFIFSKDFNDVSLVQIEDIPDEESREIVRNILKLTEGWEPNHNEMEQIRRLLSEAGMHEKIVRSNRHYIAQQYQLHCAIYNRFSSLKELREGFMETGFFELFSDREYLLEAAFPSSTKVEVSAEEIISRVTYRGLDHSGIKARFENYVRSLDKTERKNLVEAWTGSMIIPPEGLQIEVTSSGRFLIRTCFCLMIIPTTCNMEEMITNVRVNGSRGFGEI